MLANGGITLSTATTVMTASAATTKSGGREEGFPIP